VAFSSPYTLASLEKNIRAGFRIRPRVRHAGLGPFAFCLLEAGQYPQANSRETHKANQPRREQPNFFGIHSRPSSDQRFTKNGWQYAKVPWQGTVYFCGRDK
jgi:hypothetical protein